jgi:hypothetical protein
MEMMMKIEFERGLDINTDDGLAEAIVDVIADEYPGGASMRALMKRLPYGERVRVTVARLIEDGWLEFGGMLYHKARGG